MPEVSRVTGVRCFLIAPVYAKTFAFNQSKAWDKHEILHWQNLATGEKHDEPAEFGVGAMWFASYYPKNFEWSNETEPHLIVQTPGGPWDIDGRVSNCSLAMDTTHRCLCRHGQAPNVTVDKNGHTCEAGKNGSIIIGDFTGTLREGEIIATAASAA